MRSACALSGAPSTRSTFTTTVCGASFSKSWMPIDTGTRRSRMKMWRMSVLLFLVEGDVAGPAREMLAGIDDQRIPGIARRPQDEAQGAHQVFGHDADAERIGGMVAREGGVRLVAAAQRQAGRDTGDPDARREGLRQQSRQPLQADLGERVGEKVGIEIEQLLIKQVHD